MFAGLFSYGDFNQISRRLAHFPVLYLVAALALAALNYCLRYLRWSYYLQVLKIRVPFRVSSLVFLSGLAMSITPGKMGEFLKSYLLRDRCQVPIAASAPVVLMERLTDVTSVILLGLIGLFLLPLSVALLLAVLMLLSGGALFLITSRYSDGLFRLPVLRKWQGQTRSSRDGIKTLASPKVLAMGVLLGSSAWLSEGVALWVILEALDTDLAMVQALPIYAASTIVGALTALPGGLIGTEGSMVALLQQAGAGKVAASTATLLVRLATLWFAVIVGLFAMAWLARLRTGRHSRSSSSQAIYRDQGVDFDTPSAAQSTLADSTEADSLALPLSSPE